ncbi:MAG: diguanylate cyclase, partial [Oscillospiraceae bacterium]
FLRDFMREEAMAGLHPDRLLTMKEYLASYQQEYQFDSVFFVSAKTGIYYHYQTGADRLMTPDNPENEWYFDFLSASTDCSLNVDNDETKDNVITIFVNCKLYDEDKNVLGIVGVGMETPYIQQFLIENEQKYGAHAYLIDARGNIQLSSQLTEFEQVNLFQDQAFQGMASAIDTTTTATNQRWYHSVEADGYIITRYVPNLNWYLVVEKNTEDFRSKMLAQLGMDFMFLVLVVSVVILITTGVIKSYNHRLLNLAEVDQLTGIRNRTSYEREISDAASRLGSSKNFGIGIFDLNNLKTTNDRCGHQAGDEYLQIFAAMLCKSFDPCPVFRIGGDEFAIIFENVSEEAVLKKWGDFSRDVEERKSRGGLLISAAFGYAFWEAETLSTMDQIFKAADDHMYLNKAQLKGEAFGNEPGEPLNI